MPYAGMAWVRVSQVFEVLGAKSVEYGQRENTSGNPR
jgi:hypothetical protein